MQSHHVEMMDTIFIKHSSMWDSYRRPCTYGRNQKWKNIFIDIMCCASDDKVNREGRQEEKASKQKKNWKTLSQFCLWLHWRKISDTCVHFSFWKHSKGRFFFVLCRILRKRSSDDFFCFFFCFLSSGKWRNGKWNLCIIRLARWLYKLIIWLCNGYVVKSVLFCMYGTHISIQYLLWKNSCRCYFWKMYIIVSR